MIFHFFYEFHSFFWVFLEKSHDQINKWMTDFFIEDWFIIQYFLEHLCSIIGVKRWSLINHFIKTAPKCPPVEGLSMPSFLNHFWRSIFAGSTDGRSPNMIRINSGFRHSKVSKFQVSIFINKNVLRFQAEIIQINTLWRLYCANANIPMPILIVKHRKKF